MKAKNLIITISIVCAVIIIGIIAYFAIHMINLNKYAKADEYEIKNQKIPSVKSVVGEIKLDNYKHSKGGTETLELTFIDSNKEETVAKYMDNLKENGMYIEMTNVQENERRFAIYTEETSELLTIETRTTDKGFVLKIEVGPGSIQVTTQD